MEKRLAQRYPRKNQHHLRVSFSTIQAFKKAHLNLEGQVLKDIKEASQLTRQWAKKQEIQEDVAATGAYQEAIAKIAEQEVDTRLEIIKVFSIIESRMEMLFDKASSIDYVDKDVEKLLIDYLKQFQSVIDQHKKYEEGYKEQVDINVNVNVMTEQVSIMRDAVRETLSEVSPELTLSFMNKINNKMKKLSYGSDIAANKHAMLLDSVLSPDSIIDAEYE